MKITVRKVGSRWQPVDSRGTVVRGDVYNANGRGYSTKEGAAEAAEMLRVSRSWKPHVREVKRAHATISTEAPDDSWLVVMDALMSGDAKLAADVWNRLYYEAGMTPPSPPERFTKALKSKGKNKIDKSVLDKFKQLAPRYESLFKRDARIVEGRGMGGFMDPPGYPTHTFHVETDLGRRPHNRGSMSVTAAAEERGSVDPTTRKEAQELLDKWDRNRPSLDSPKVQAWIAEVIRHFGNTGRAVEQIQKFYPEYEPTT